MKDATGRVLPPGDTVYCVVFSADNTGFPCRIGRFRYQGPLVPEADDDWSFGPFEADPPEEKKRSGQLFLRGSETWPTRTQAVDAAIAKAEANLEAARILAATIDEFNL